MFTAWTYNSPWATDYMVFDSAAATNFSLPQLFAGSPMPVSSYPGFGSATAAFDAAVTGNYVNQIKVAPGGRHTGTAATQYTFAAAQNVDLCNSRTMFSAITTVASPSWLARWSAFLATTTTTAPSMLPITWLWHKSNNTATTLPNDSTSGTDQSDYDVWRSHFGQTAGNGAGAIANAAIPEPATFVLLMFAAAGWCLQRSRSSIEKSQQLINA